MFRRNILLVVGLLMFAALSLSSCVVDGYAESVVVPYPRPYYHYTPRVIYYRPTPPPPPPRRTVPPPPRPRGRR